MIYIQWTKFQKKSIVTFISEELPYGDLWKFLMKAEIHFWQGSPREVNVDFVLSLGNLT